MRHWFFGGIVLVRSTRMSGLCLPKVLSVLGAGLGAFGILIGAIGSLRVVKIGIGRNPDKLTSLNFGSIVHRYQQLNVVHYIILDGRSLITSNHTSLQISDTSI